MIYESIVLVKHSAFFLLFCVGCESRLTAVDLRHAAMLGPEEAPVEVIVFSDFQCPACKRAAAEIKRIHAEYPRDDANFC